MKMGKTVLVLLLLAMAGIVSAADKTNEKGKNADEEAGEPDPTIMLESTFVGDKEQPAISYFIPWKGNETPDKLQWNMEPKHDQTLQVIDRDVLVNSMNIYNEMNMEASVSSN